MQAKAVRRFRRKEVASYFHELETKGISINFGSYFSETQTRVAVLKYAAREPTPEELTRMRGIMETAMKGGAMGMTTALIYPPSSYTKTPELIDIAKVAAKYGGIYASHIRGEGADVVQSIDEAIEIGEKAGLPVEVFHLKAAYQPGWGTLMREAGNISTRRGRAAWMSQPTCICTRQEGQGLRRPSLRGLTMAACRP